MHLPKCANRHSKITSFFLEFCFVCKKTQNLTNSFVQEFSCRFSQILCQICVCKRIFFTNSLNFYKYIMIKLVFIHFTKLHCSCTYNLYIHILYFNTISEKHTTNTIYRRYNSKAHNTIRIQSVRYLSISIICKNIHYQTIHNCKIQKNNNQTCYTQIQHINHTILAYFATT